MSETGNNRPSVQEDPAYRWGWEWAELGMELHAWLLPHLGTTQSDAARQGWKDYHVTLAHAHLMQETK